MLDRFRFLWFGRRRLRRRGVCAERGSYCDASTQFEGRNRVAAGARVTASRIGMATYVAERAVLDRTFVGRFSSIGPRVETVIGAHPVDTFVSTHPAFFSRRAQAGFTFVSSNRFAEFGSRQFRSRYLIEIGSDVWIGHSALIMQGVQIGDGAIVAAGSVVTRDVPAYAVYAGAPAKLRRYRFDADLVERLLKCAWWEWEFSEIERWAPYFESPAQLLEALQPEPESATPVAR